MEILARLNNYLKIIITIAFVHIYGLKILNQ